MRDYPIRPVPFTSVTFSDEFWAPRLETNRRVTLPYVLEKCRETGRINNFRKAAGVIDGRHEGREFNDTDVYKAIEAAGYSLQFRRDEGLEAEIDALIELIEAAQEPDGYLYTARTIDPEDVDPELEGRERWSNLRWSHELYCLGHLFEASVAYYQATGKRRLLDVSLRSAELVDRVFGPEGRHDVPGHQEIEIGLVRLYRVTGEERWLRLAKFFLDGRGHHEGRSVYDGFGVEGYSQDHMPLVEQRVAVGHAVRAGYGYAAMADVAALAGADEYLPALEAIWQDVVSRKMYLTGGAGAHHESEAYGQPYELPNRTAYAETCAAVANVMWNQRMFLLYGDGRYVDVLERILYNGLLSGVALEGSEFFYPNPLASDGRYAFNMEGAATRCPWFSVSCCPGNIVRFFPSLPGYAYAVRGETAYVNLFVAGEARLEMDVGAVILRQSTRYPWDGLVGVEVLPEEPVEFTLALRVPGWVRGEPLPSDLYRYLGDDEGGPMRGQDLPGLRVDGEEVYAPMEDGYLRLTRTWRGGESVELRLPMPVRRVASHPAVRENGGRVAVERGPLVYCAEAADNGGRALDLALPDNARLEPVEAGGLLGGITMLRASSGLTLVPYYSWSHRGEGEMAVWLRRVATSQAAREPAAR